MNMHRDKFDHIYEFALSEVYNCYVQLLYKYGMHVCEDREVVLNAITQLFIHVRNQGKLFVTGAALRFSLFKRLRDLLSANVASPNSPLIHKGITARPVTEGIDQPAPELSQRQLEAVFLKSYCQFTYEEVAAIMHLDGESSYGLVTQALEILGRQYKKKQDQLPAYTAFNFME
jgi:hypothetical protein